MRPRKGQEDGMSNTLASLQTSSLKFRAGMSEVMDRLSTETCFLCEEELCILFHFL